jgi:methylmalonyl-CoA mutase N-terminal domain/subunit
MEWVENNGGMVSLIEKGVIQSEFAQQAMKEEMEIQKGNHVLVGVNKFVVDEENAEDEMVFHEPDPLTRQRQIERLEEVKRQRDAHQVSITLNHLREVTEKGENIMPALIEAVKAYATLGEMVGVLKESYGTYSALSGF